MRKENVKNICAKKEDLENLKANFLKKLSDCQNEDDKAKLMKEHDDMNKKIHDEIDRMTFDGAIGLETRAA